MSDRTFTLEEAQSLLPVLESLLRSAIAGKQVMDEVEAEQQSLSHRIFLNGGMHVDVVQLARRKGERIVESHEEFLAYPQTSPEIYEWLPYHRDAAENLDS